jgi:MoaA/NifB/PqqE/SkfB family radical SAM enzyme
LGNDWRGLGSTILGTSGHVHTTVHASLIPVMSSHTTDLHTVTSALGAHRVPVNATLETTYGCNLNCVHCFNPTHKATSRELSTAQLQHIIDGLAAVGTLSLALTGGEALTRPDLCELLAYAKAQGMLVTLFTNATLITPEIADRLAALELYRVDISSYGATAEAYESVTRVPGSFAKFVRGLELLLERHIPVRLKSIVVTLNAHELDAMRDFAESRGVHFEFLTDIQPKANGDAEPLAYRVTPKVATDLWESQVLRRNTQGVAREETSSELNSCDRGKETLFQCACGQTSCGISPYGEMNLCVSYQLPQYDLLHGSVADGWEVLKDTVDTAQPQPDFPCPTCPVESSCTRNVNHALLEMDDMNACIPYYLESAQRKQALLNTFAV